MESFADDSLWRKTTCTLEAINSALWNQSKWNEHDLAKAGCHPSCTRITYRLQASTATTEMSKQQLRAIYGDELAKYVRM